MKQAFFRTLETIKMHWYLILLIVALDIAFLYAFGKVYASIFQTTAAHLDTINQLLQGSIGQFTTTSDPGALNIGIEQFNQEVAFVKLGIAYILGYLLLFWLAFQGPAWYIIHRITGKPRLPRFALRFVLTTIIGFAAFVGILIGIVALSFKTFSSPLPLIGQGGINTLAAIAVLALAYLVFVAYALPDNVQFWRSFVRTAFRRITTTGLAYVLVLIVLAVLYAIMIWVLKQNVLAGFAFGAIILLPIFAALRVFFVESIKEKD
ncbi:hypothetical protein HY493_02725 [Candidatus Woesearchaeota archaeon]|nr:hypothetical protein [Candidatus Woesearchaeota archaeon]